MNEERLDSGDLMILLGEATQRPLTPEEADYFRRMLMRDAELLDCGIDVDAMLVELRRKNGARYQPLRDPSFEISEFLKRFGAPSVDWAKERSNIAYSVSRGDEATPAIVDFISRHAGFTRYRAQQEFAAFLCATDDATTFATVLERVKQRCKRRR